MDSNSHRLVFGRILSLLSFACGWIGAYRWVSTVYYHHDYGQHSFALITLAAFLAVGFGIGALMLLRFANSKQARTTLVQLFTAAAVIGIVLGSLFLLIGLWKIGFPAI